MADRQTAERVTGYQTGGISPLGSRRRLRTFIDDSAASLPALFLNAGGRGMIVEAGTAALVAHLDAALVPLTRGMIDSTTTRV
jgi:Cys-tRNA(Pro)/Cys-tRNA(Cys) deacylase